MRVIQRGDLREEKLPGRVIQKAVGRDALSKSEKMTMGFAHYSARSGPMEPHRHAEEIVYVVSAKRARARHGPAKEELGGGTPLSAGMILHFPELEWHVFECGKGGRLDIIFFYGQVDNIRPEEILKKQ
jgi:hypothetical protein